MKKYNRLYRAITDGGNMVTDLHFTPCLFYFGLLGEAEVFEIESCENYNKRSFRNKCLFKNNYGGAQSFSIPLSKGKHSGQPIREVRISYTENWIRILRQTLQSQYGKSPFFTYYFEDYISIVEKEHVFLFDLNLEILHFFCSILDLPVPDTTTVYKTHLADRYHDLRDCMIPKTFNEISALSQEQCIEYFRITPSHSVVEALFQYGPETSYLLKCIIKQVRLH